MRIPLCLGLALLAGCPDRTISALPPVSGAVSTKDIPANPRRDVDILFLIDNSASMKEEQASLLLNFHRFIDVLQSLDGGLPNIHIAVTTSDLGTSTADGADSGNKLGCNGKGNDGKLVPLSPNGPRYIEDVDDGAGGRKRNYTGSLSDVFSQIADVGVMGCGIEQHLEAVKRALEPTNSINAGFLRKDAYLAVIVIADEDDCSLQHTGLFDGNDANIGTEINFRCTSEGVACDDPSTDFLSATGLRKDCHPRASSPHLEDTTEIADFIKDLKTNPKDVIVAGIVGPTSPFTITKDATNTTVLDHSCKYTGTAGDQFAFPAVRTANFLEQFPERNTQTTICGADLSSGLTQIGALLKTVIADPCFDVQLEDVDPNTDGAQYDCTVTEVREVANQPDQEVDVIPSCLQRASAPCWTVVEDADHCSYTHTNPHLALHIDRGGATVPDDIHIKASCVATEASGQVQ